MMYPQLIKDFSFVKVILDAESLHIFCHNYTKISNPLSRMLILRSVYDMAIGKNTPSSHFTDLINTIFESESDVATVNQEHDLQPRLRIDQ